jgi:hypothetical protein
VTLCMTATCWERLGERIVSWSDLRVGPDWAAADIGLKQDWVCRGWSALLAGTDSKGEDLAATFRQVLKPEEFTYDNIFDKFNQASAAHKAKLCQRLVEMNLGITFERFLTNGAQELTPEVRTRMLYKLEALQFGCSVLIFGFLLGKPYIFSVDEDGEVSIEENFAAIGTGGIIAESVLFQREQQIGYPLEETLYNMYEAFTIAHKSKATGVGEVSNVWIYEPTNDGWMKSKQLTPMGESVLKVHFERYGPKRIDQSPRMDASCFQEYDLTVRKESDKPD